MIAKVVVDISNSEVDRIFEYSIPEDLDISAGDRVAVAFGKQGTIEGFVVGLSEKQEYKVQKRRARQGVRRERPLRLNR